MKNIGNNICKVQEEVGTNISSVEEQALLKKLGIFDSIKLNRELEYKYPCQTPWDFFRDSEKITIYRIYNINGYCPFYEILIAHNLSNINIEDIEDNYGKYKKITGNIYGRYKKYGNPFTIRKIIAFKKNEFNEKLFKKSLRKEYGLMWKGEFIGQIEEFNDIKYYIFGCSYNEIYCFL